MLKSKSELKFEKELLLLERRNNEIKHEQKMKELEFIRESENIRHNLELERQRIKSAEIRKSMERKSWEKFGENYIKEK